MSARGSTAEFLETRIGWLDVVPVTDNTGGTMLAIVVDGGYPAPPDQTWAEMKAYYIAYLILMLESDGVDLSHSPLAEYKDHPLVQRTLEGALTPAMQNSSAAGTI